MALLRHFQRAQTAVSPHPGNPNWIIPIRPGGLPVNAVQFGGTTAFQNFTTDAMADGPDFTISCWLRYDLAPHANPENIFVNGDFAQADVGIRIRREDTSNSMLFELIAPGGITSVQWKRDILQGVAMHFALSIAGANSLSGQTSVGQLFIDGVDQGAPDVGAFTDINLGAALYAIAGGNQAANAIFPLTGGMAEFWAHNVFIDLAAGGLDSFWRDSKSVFLGTNGELPAAAAPNFFMGGPMRAFTGGVADTGWNGGVNQANNAQDFSIFGFPVQDISTNSTQLPPP